MAQKINFRSRVMRKIGSTRLLALSFLFVIILGTVLLLLPVCSNNSPLGFIDTLFIATSATCVTGLVPVSLFEQYNIIGHTVILLLIQIGGLGLMSLIAFAMIILKHRLHYSEKKMIQDALNKQDLQDVPRFLKSIVQYSFFFEMIGALLIMVRFVPRFGILQGIYNSVFLSVSAFCNAGMDNFSHFSLNEYVTDPYLNLIVAALIIVGGLGFTVWFDLSLQTKNSIRKKYNCKKWFSSLSIHTKIVLLMTVGLLASGTALFYLVESSNSLVLGNMSIPEKILVSFFQSVTLRTAGFSTVDFSLLRESSLFMMLGFMLIGGSPGGTAGGIKTTAVVMMFLIIRSQLAGNEDMTIFKRSISKESFHRAFVIAITYISILTVAIFLLSLTENATVLSLCFEAVSAIATVGLSAGLTASLSGFGKVIIILLMFIGRVGPITIVMAMTRFKALHKPSEVRYPKTDILIG